MSDVERMAGELEAWHTTRDGAEFIAWCHLQLAPRLATLLERRGIDPARSRLVGQTMVGSFAALVAAIVVATAPLSKNVN